MHRIQHIYDKNQQGDWYPCEGILLREKTQEKRQLSFITSIGLKQQMETTERGFCHDRFKANFTMEEMVLESLNTESLYSMGDAAIRITEIGKRCHPNCPLVMKSTRCDIQEHIFFATIVKSGWVQIGDSLLIQARA